MKKKKKLPETQEEFDRYLKSFIVAALRRATFYWPYRNESLKAARVERGLYRCAMCGDSKLHPKKDIQIDHIDPVVKLSGFTNWDNYFNRMFVKTEGFQILCKSHHAETR